ncbi:MAG TPA: M23 family metallopeptidase [Nevskiaceae bacterium]|nr:M23 family metallopeptidase [Nevskiaceae bacterium]
MDRKSSFAIAMVALGLSACATLEQYKIEGGEMAGKAADATGEFVATYADIVMASGKSAAQRMTEYLYKKELLKTFTDAADEGEDALVYLRRRASIGGFSEGRLPKFKTFDMPDLPETYAGEYDWPTEAGIISSEYGRRFGRLHKGIDVAADIGEPIHAIAEGYVVYAGNKIEGYGNIVVLRHDASTMTLYAHNSRMKVKTGQHVKQGQVIALLGNSGRSTGPHSHFEIRREEVPVNPREMLVKGPFEDPSLQGQLDPLREFLLASRED